MIKTFVRAALDEQNTMKKAIVDSVSYIGCVIWCAGNVTPDNTIYCDGSAVSRTTYAELFAAIGTTYGAGDGSSTFNIPDLRGYFIRGTGGNAAALGAEQGDTIRNIIGTFSECAYQNQAGSPNDVYLRGTGAFRTWTESTSNRTGVPINTQIVIADGGDGAYFDASRVVPTAAENRPINYAMRPCIIYQ